MTQTFKLKPPYYALICTSKEGMVSKLIELASKEKGFLGKDIYDDNLSISYWESIEDIKKVKKNLVTDVNCLFNICKIEDNYIS